MDSSAQEERTLYHSSPSLQLKIKALKKGKRLGKNHREAKRLAKIYLTQFKTRKHTETVSIALQKSQQEGDEEIKEVGAKKMKGARSRPIKQIKKLRTSVRSSTSIRRSPSLQSSSTGLRAQELRQEGGRKIITLEKQFFTSLVNIHVLYSLRETMTANLEMLIQRIRDFLQTPPEDSVLENYGSLLQDQMSKLQLINNSINAELQKYESVVTAM